jgi:hypothetical protein
VAIGLETGLGFVAFGGAGYVVLAVNQRRAVRPQCGQKVNELRVYFLETTGWACSFGSPDGSVNTPPRSTTLFAAPIMPTKMLSNSSGISATVISRCEC